MKKTIIFALGILFSTSVLGSTDHYIRKDGGHVQHLKITRHGNDARVWMDVDFEPTGGETDRPCSAEISGEAKLVGENELHLKKQAAGEAHYCELTIMVNGDEAKIDASPDCIRFFTGDFCRFDSEGKVLTRLK